MSAQARKQSDAPREGRRPALRVALWTGLVALYVASRIAAGFTVAANWDEFALLDRAATSARTGVLGGGGRPGLATLVLMPFAADCQDEIAAVRQARMLWVGFTLCFLAGLGALLRQVCAHSKHTTSDAWLGVGLLALVPAFLEWSLQVRTDQLALAFGLWGGVALLASRQRPAWALVSGLLFGAGYLATQKIVYVAALVGVLALGQLRAARELRPGREALRGVLAAAAFAATVAGFDAATAVRLDVPDGHSAMSSLTPAVVGQQLSEFAYYRKTIGYSQYLEILPTLGPHLFLLAALVVVTAASSRRRALRTEPLWVAWATLAVGACVAAFHASAFAYFWMTLGLFPAVALAVSGDSLRAALPGPRARVAALATAGVWLVLGAQGVFRAAELSIDTQAVQRESLAFVHRNFDDSDSGFHPEHGPFCRNEPKPFNLYFSQVLYRHFAGEQRETYTRNFLANLRSRRVKFVVESFRLNQFPVEIRRFLAENYQPYRASVFVAGRQLAGASGESVDFELIVPGRYRWLPFEAPSRLRIGGHTLAPGETAELDVGSHRADFVEDVAGGMLVLAVNDPPDVAPLSFYKTY
ncbi:MAG: hypothetical protein ACE5FL_01015 [Myxococcota bacterium]